MDKQRIDEIELITRDIIAQVTEDPSTVEPPTNLAAILKHYRVKLAFARFEDPDIGGAYDKVQKTIYVDASERPTRQAFTVAHELGHFVLHKKRTQDTFFRSQIYSFNGEDEKKEEKEANWFAASLLMPKEPVKRFWAKQKDTKLLAAYFGVSESAAYWRLKNLRLIK